MKFLHTMVRITDMEESVDFYCNKLGLVEINRIENEQGRFTLIFLAAPEDVALAKKTKTPLLELTYNWDSEPVASGRSFGHLAYLVTDIYTVCEKLMQAGVTVHRPPRDGHMAFIKSPDNISIEILQKGEALPPQEPWHSMSNSGEKW